jgi:hypothetical protein
VREPARDEPEPTNRGQPVHRTRIVRSMSSSPRRIACRI